MAGHGDQTVAGARVQAGPKRPEIACLASAPWNPYLGLLYDHLASAGLRLAPDAELTVPWLWRRRDSVGFLHFHWPEGHYRHDRGPRRLRPLLSWVKLAFFAVRLAVARLLGYRLAWTIHQVYPHEQDNPLRDRVAARLLGASCHVLLTHDRPTAATAARELHRPPHSVHVIPHGSYIGVYEPGRSRNAVRAELDVPDEAFVFLVFGELRLYKGIGVLLRAWSAAQLPPAALVIAGNAKERAAADAVDVAATADARIKPLLGFRPQDEVAELFAASDAAVFPRSDGGTSGSLILALSLGVPVVFAERPAYLELMGGAPAGWGFRPGDVDSLRGALEAAAADPGAAAARGAAALAVARRLDWTEIAARTAAVLRAAAAPRAE